MNEDKNIPKKKQQRSTSYPSISLESATEATALLREKLGQGPYSRESAANAWGNKLTGASAMKIATLVHFGLLRREGNAYYQSDLATKILIYTDEAEKLEGMREAVQRPKLYKQLIENYKGQALPTMLESILIRQFGITERVSKEAASVFRKSLEHAELLKNGVVMEGDSTENTTASDVDTGNKDHTQKHNAQLRSNDDNTGDSLVTLGSKHAGRGWGLVFEFSGKNRIKSDLRKEVRDIIDKVDELAEKLYVQEEDKGM